ncbi:MAG TPA: hypothetical protein VLA31_05785 [Burkholderiaceae bacterium]|nr:hypothetical protein [Burkholderiaceae bacterium]
MSRYIDSLHTNVRQTIALELTRLGHVAPARDPLVQERRLVMQDRDADLQSALNRIESHCHSRDDVNLIRNYIGL